MATPKDPSGRGPTRRGGSDAAGSDNVPALLNDKKLGEILVREQVVDVERLERARQEMERRGAARRVLAELGLVEESKLVNS